MGGRRTTINFGAGPAALPEPVLAQIKSELLDYNGEGVSVLELSHRTTTFGKIIQSAEERIRHLVGVNDEYAVLFMQGGGTLQFAAAPMNLVAEKAQRLDYIQTGQWSVKATEEAAALGYTNVRSYTLTGQDVSETGIAALKRHMYANGTPSYVYYCDNETIDGIEFPSSSYLADELGIDPAETCLVCDMSSNFLSRPIDMSKFGLVFASAQKNIGPAGVTVVIVKRCWLDPSIKGIPKMMGYRLFVSEASLSNTPPVFAVYVTELVLAWIEKTFDGSLAKVHEFSKAKAQLVYDAIDNSAGRLVNSVPKQFRSRMNVVWHYPDSSDEDAFLAAAKAHRMVQLKGHRSIGGMRASLYNAITMEDAIELTKLMKRLL